MRYSTREDVDNSQPEKPAKKPAKYRPQLGFDIGYTDGYFLNSGAFSDAELGWCIGMTAMVPLSGHCFFQPGIYYSNYGGELISSAFDANYSSITDLVWHVNAIEVPLNIGFWFGKQRRSYYGSFVSFGGFVAYNLNGSSNSSNIFGHGANGTEALVIGTTPTADIRPINYGIDFNIGAAYRVGFFYAVKIKYGLANLSNAGDGVLNTFNGSVTLGWLVGDRGQKKHIPRPAHYVNPNL